MKRLTISVIRKAILADGDEDLNVTRAALVIIECIDWRTNQKEFLAKKHLTNWLSAIAATYAVEEKFMREGVDYMTSLGLMDLESNGKGGYILMSGLVEDE